MSTSERLLASLYFICYVTTAASSHPSKPNVVLFMADDLGIGDIGCFGNDTIRTPNIDRIASEGVKLTHHLAAASLCTPSRAAFQTGRYPVRMGMAAHHIVRVNLFLSSVSGLPTNETTFAHVAKRHGYSTALIGKWHLGVNCETDGDFCHHPLKKGYDYFYGIPLTNMRDFGNHPENHIQTQLKYFKPTMIALALGGLIASYFLFKRGIWGKCGVLMMVLFIGLPSFLFYFTFTNMKLLNSVVMRNYDYVEQPIHLKNFTQRLVNEGVNYLEARKTDQQPFLLVIPWVQVHTVLHNADEFKGHSKHGEYGDNVEEMDWSVGEIVNGLERLGMLNNTLVYFTSDQGGHLEEKGPDGSQEGGWNGIYRGGKGQGGMEGGIRTPTVMMWRGHIAPNSVVDVPTSLMDIFPTLSAAVWNEPLPTDRIIDGKNIYPLITGRDSRPPHQFLFHYCGTELHAARYIPGDGKDVYKVHYATPDWLPGTQGCRFICHCHRVTWHDPPLLYNIGRDPAEKELLSLNQSDHLKIISIINDAVREHLEGVDNVPSQYTIGKLVPRPWLQPCCNFPSCSCVDPEYAQLVERTN